MVCVSERVGGEPFDIWLFQTCSPSCRWMMFSPRFQVFWSPDPTGFHPFPFETKNENVKFCFLHQRQIGERWQRAGRIVWLVQLSVCFRLWCGLWVGDMIDNCHEHDNTVLRCCWAALIPWFPRVNIRPHCAGSLASDAGRWAGLSSLTSTRFPTSLYFCLSIRSLYCRRKCGSTDYKQNRNAPCSFFSLVSSAADKIKSHHFKTSGVTVYFQVFYVLHFDQGLQSYSFRVSTYLLYLPTHHVTNGDEPFFAPLGSLSTHRSNSNQLI